MAPSSNVVARCRLFRSLCSSPASHIPKNKSSLLSSPPLPSSPPTTSVAPREGIHLVVPGQRCFSALSWHDEVDSLSLSERQEGFLLEKFSPSLSVSDLFSILKPEIPGLAMGDILLLQSRLGKSLCRAVVKCAEHRPYVKKLVPGMEDSVGKFVGEEFGAGAFASGAEASGRGTDGGVGSSGLPVLPAQAAFPDTSCTYRPLDRHDIRLLVEQAEAIQKFSEDLHFLARPDHFERVVTLHNIPKSYGRKDVIKVLAEKVCPSFETLPAGHVVFNWKKFGIQADSCFVLCRSNKQADRVIGREVNNKEADRVIGREVLVPWTIRISTAVPDPCSVSPWTISISPATIPTIATWRHSPTLCSLSPAATIPASRLRHSPTLCSLSPATIPSDGHTKGPHRPPSSPPSSPAGGPPTLSISPATGSLRTTLRTTTRGAASSCTMAGEIVSQQVISLMTPQPPCRSWRSPDKTKIKKKMIRVPQFFKSMFICVAWGPGLYVVSGRLSVMGGRPSPQDEKRTTLKTLLSLPLWPTRGPPLRQLP